MEINHGFLFKYPEKPKYNRIIEILNANSGIIIYVYVSAQC